MSRDDETTVEDGVMGVGKYRKICTYCHKPYRSNSRNQRYCCSEHAQKKNKQKTVRRKQYKADASYESMINKAYRLSMEVALEFVPKPTHLNGVEVKPDELELHHRDSNVFNCSPLNLHWVVKGIHTKYHSVLPRVNMVTFLKILKGKTEILTELWDHYDHEILVEKRYVADDFTVFPIMKKWQVKSND